MPYGAQTLPDQAVRFRLWAPGAKRVAVLTGEPGRETSIPLDPAGDGWFERDVEDARAGTLYRFQVDGHGPFPDPASRFQPADVHGPSEVIDPEAFAWSDPDWKGRPWEEAVFYELHTGSFTPEGTFAGVERKLEHFLGLGVTAIEIMPVADFPGSRNWGYDGVLPFAPDSSYGRPEELKALVQAAHARGLMVFLDVVYNHFGPEGNYLPLYAPSFFTDRHSTPWGAAINFDGEGSRWVREYFIHNALYWLEEYNFDGLRLDAVHAIVDESRPDVLEELAERVHAGPGASRHVHLVLENDDNAARYLERDGGPSRYVAQWNDDIHHAFHVITTGETSGYYADYADRPLEHLGRCLSEGFAYQGDPSPFRDGAKRGEPSRDLPPTAFVSFIQNHDQVGNRAFGERLTELAPGEAVRAATAILLLAPSPPLLFMGEEWETRERFPFFCDLGPELAPKVTEGRRREFAKFPQFSDPAARETIPDPVAPETFRSAILDWSVLDRSETAREAFLFHRRLLGIRRREIVPRLPGIPGAASSHATVGEQGLDARWEMGDGSLLRLVANLGGDGLSGVPKPAGRLIFSFPEEPIATLDAGRLPPWSVAWFLEKARPGGSREDTEEEG